MDVLRTNEVGSRIYAEQFVPISQSDLEFVLGIDELPVPREVTHWHIYLWDADFAPNGPHIDFECVSLDAEGNVVKGSEPWQAEVPADMDGFNLSVQQLTSEGIAGVATQWYKEWLELEAEDNEE